MSGLDDDLHKDRPSSWKQKPRKSMDMEFHDMDLDSLDDELEYERKVAASAEAGDKISNDTTIYNGKYTNSFRKDDDNDSDDDTFGEASDDCEPDQNYLDELLDECHPERVNLLDYTFAPQISVSDDGTQDYDVDDESYQRKRRKNGMLPSNSRRGGDYSPDSSVNSASDNDSDEDENDFPPPWSSSRLGSDTSVNRESDKEDEVAHGRRKDGRDFKTKISPEKYVPDKADPTNGRYEEVQCGVTEDSSAPEESEDGGLDYYDDNAAAASSAAAPKRRLKDQLEQMGQAGKKSFRQVSKTTFWAQPFKGLGRPKRRGKLADVEGEELSP
jgi:hypothetical protein